MSSSPHARSAAVRAELASAPKRAAAGRSLDDLETIIGAEQEQEAAAAEPDVMASPQATAIGNVGPTISQLAQTRDRVYNGIAQDMTLSASGRGAQQRVADVSFAASIDRIRTTVIGPQCDALLSRFSPWVWPAPAPALSAELQLVASINHDAAPDYLVSFALQNLQTATTGTAAADKLDANQRLRFLAPLVTRRAENPESWVPEPWRALYERLGELVTTHLDAVSRSEHTRVASEFVDGARTGFEWLVSNVQNNRPYPGDMVLAIGARQLFAGELTVPSDTPYKIPA